MATVIASCFVPVPALVEANKRRGDHWGLKKERKDERIEHTLATLRSMPLSSGLRIRVAARAHPMVVRLISVSVQEPNDDNLGGALKHYRDAVAFWLGIPDEDPRVKYVAKWERYRGKGKRGVRIEFVRFLDHLIEEKARIEAEIAALSGDR